MLPLARSATALRAALFSLAALAAAVLGAVMAPDVAADHEILLWLLAVIPAFLVAHYRGWDGVAAALAIAMVALTVVQATSSVLGAGVQSWSVAVRVILVFAGTMLAVGVLAGMLYRARDELDRLEITDAVTELPNRRHAELVLDREVAAALRGRALTVVLFEVDRFRELRTRHGEEGADQVLQRFGRALGRSTRRMNFSARLEGGRFLSILSSGGLEGARVFVRRVQAAATGLDSGGPGFSVSAGVACHEPGMRSVDDMLRAADLALFQAQQSGAGSVGVHEAAERAAAIQASLRQLRDMLGESSRLGLEGT